MSQFLCERVGIGIVIDLSLSAELLDHLVDNAVPRLLIGDAVFGIMDILS